MNKILNKITLCAAVAAASLTLQGCLEEEMPMDMATAEQVAESSSAQEALLRGLSAMMVKTGVYGDYSNYDNAYPSQMITRDVLCDFMPVYDSYYDYYMGLATGNSLRSPFNYTYYFYYSLVSNANSIILSLDVDGATEDTKVSAGIAYAYRALAYLDMARMFEYKETGFSELDSKASKVWGLTVPIVTEKTTPEQGKNNPRAPFYTMYRFILHDLNKAENYLKNYQSTEIAVPDVDVVRGFMARFWLELGTRFSTVPEDLATQLAHEGDDDGYDALGITTAQDCFANAAKKAKEVIDYSGCTPMSKTQWYDTTTGFNQANSAWVWGGSLSKKEQLGEWFYSWMGTMSSESDAFSMGAQCLTYRMISARLFNNIPDGDWRKKTWVAPEDAGANKVPNGYSTLLSDSEWKKLPAYANLKYHPNQGELVDFYIGCLCDIPFMRIEEMYFIYIEALAHTQGAAVASQELTHFMNTYRYSDGSFNLNTSDVQELTDAVFINKSIELWGEGLMFFDYKRLRKAVVRTYPGTNYLERQRLNSYDNHVAPWMNAYISEYEQGTNPAVILNPDATGLIKPISE